MPLIVFIQPDGSTQQVEAAEGGSVMQAAVNALVPGIVADCGGACACATCHGYIDDAWVERVPTASLEEIEMIDGGCTDVRPTSRLTCQVKLTTGLNGLTIRLPPSQGSK
jgi:2Fe-2S ferredoxin